MTFDKALDRRELTNFLSLPIFQEIGRPLEIVKAFQGKESFFAAMHELHDLIYQ